MSYYRNPEPSPPEEDYDPRPRDRWGRFLPFGPEEEEEEEVVEAIEEEPVEEDDFEDDYEDDDDYDE